MAKHAVGIQNGNWRAGYYYQRAQEIKKQQTDPSYIHPRDAKLNQLRGYMDPDSFARWFAGYDQLRHLDQREAALDAKLAEFADRVHEDAEIKMLTDRARVIGEGLALCNLPARAIEELESELIEIGHALQRYGLALPDDHADIQRGIDCGAMV